jgi:hypothetical protein
MTRVTLEAASIPLACIPTSENYDSVQFAKNDLNPSRVRSHEG